MKDHSSPRKGHNVDIPRRAPRSEEERQEALPRRPKGTPPSRTQARPPRRSLVEDAEGFQTVVHHRRSPRRNPTAEDRDFEPEAPAGKVKAAAKASKLSVAQSIELGQLNHIRHTHRNRVSTTITLGTLIYNPNRLQIPQMYI